MNIVPIIILLFALVLVAVGVITGEFSRPRALSAADMEQAISLCRVAGGSPVPVYAKGTPEKVFKIHCDGANQ